MSRADQSNSESRHTISTESRRTFSSESRYRISGETETDDPDLPPESIVIPITDDTPWQYSAYDSGESAREITNPKSHSNLFPWSKAGSGSNSNRVAATNLNATASAPIMGIPAKIKLPAFAHSQSPASIFPRWRNSRSKKSVLAYSEPGSPKVSCWGKVLSDKEKKKFRKQRKVTREIETKKETPSCCQGFSVIMACISDHAAKKREIGQLQLAEVHPSPVNESRPTPEEIDLNFKAEEVWQQPDEAEVLVATQTAGLGALKRLSSKRRAASWGGDVVVAKEALATQGNKSN
ncbi:hypothetical protein LUZ62_023540 [Rhynchospora pubera]|uniref:Uncharacterized protein n=1 Tax=Rhynchospora pubera TaxID=906938 RepID=A0AAV8H0V8_9POAL|nr:hypothetical protein LUZ62_023540 [Rhynchospora pubera]